VQATREELQRQQEALAAEKALMSEAISVTAAAQESAEMSAAAVASEREKVFEYEEEDLRPTGGQLVQYSAACDGGDPPADRAVVCGG
jgi:hypothetical protein